MIAKSKTESLELIAPIMPDVVSIDKETEDAFQADAITVKNVLGVNATYVSYSVVLGLSDERGNISYELGKGHDFFPGTVSSAKKEISERIDALIRRAPMPENFRTAGLPEVDGLYESMYQAGLWLSKFWHVHRDQWHTRLKESFHSYVWNLYGEKIQSIDDKFDERETYDRYRKTMTRSFEDVGKYRGIPDKPRKRSK